MANLAAEHLKRVEVSSVEDLRKWLQEHHHQPESVWLVTFKKQVPGKYISTGEVLDELLCFGWIDGIRRRLDAQRTMQLISPRKVHHWARTYQQRAERLIAEGRMQPAGLRCIELSKELGLWHFMEDVDDLKIPDDLRAQLVSKPGAMEFFESINPSSRRFALRWLKLAKIEKTRQARAAQLALLASRGEKLKGS